jgi:hypothetical protein
MKFKRIVPGMYAATTTVFADGQPTEATVRIVRSHGYLERRLWLIQVEAASGSLLCALGDAYGDTLKEAKANAEYECRCGFEHTPGLGWHRAEPATTTANILNAWSKLS